MIWNVANAAREARHSPYTLVLLVIFVSCRQKFERKRLAIAFDNVDPRAIIIANEARFGQGLQVPPTNEKGTARIALSFPPQEPAPRGKRTVPK
jgi:hypothetical protein